MALGLPGPYEAEDKDARALERENRRRKRKGLPTIKPEEVESSLQGWGLSETPAPPGLSMAEQFVQQRRRGRQAPVEVEVEDPASFAPPEDEHWLADAEHDEGWVTATEDEEELVMTPEDDEQWAPTPEDDGWGFSVPDDDTREV